MFVMTIDVRIKVEVEPGNKNFRKGGQIWMFVTTVNVRISKEADLNVCYYNRR